MSKFHVFWPDDAGSVATQDRLQVAEPDTQAEDFSEPTVSFSRWVSRLGRDSSNEMPRRAMQLARNTDCPHCRRVGSVPLTLNDGRLDTSGELVPGTATLVGFRCGHCQSEWSA